MNHFVKVPVQMSRANLADDCSHSNIGTQCLNEMYCLTICNFYVRLSKSSIVTSAVVSEAVSHEGECDLSDVSDPDDDDSGHYNSTERESDLLPSSVRRRLKLDDITEEERAEIKDIEYMDENLMTFCADSPRAIFLAGCIEQNIPPRSLAIIRNRLSTALNLEHHGIGDTVASLLAQCLPTMPAVQVLNLGDNALTDRNICPLLQAVQANGNIEELTFSSNEFSRSCATAVAGLLASKKCALTSLRIANAQVDDSSCSEIIKALVGCDSLKVFEYMPSVVPVLRGHDTWCYFFDAGIGFVQESIGRRRNHWTAFGSI